MHRSFIAFIVWFAFVLCARATSVEIPVSPTNLDTHFFTFSVSANAKKDGVAFHVMITSKEDDFYSDSSANVDRVIHKKFDQGYLPVSIGPVVPTIPVALKKEKRVWTAEFTVSRELLRDPEIHFVLSVLAHGIVDGKVIAMPSVTFYELRLQEFATP